MKLKSELKTITAFAPATCANVMVGFDILGFAMPSVGDYVTLTKRDDHAIVITKIDGDADLPLNPEKNTASLVLKKMRDDLNLAVGFDIHIKKGIAISSGMGGSAASAIAALVACNAFLVTPLTAQQLIQYALAGEALASGAEHADNIVPCLFGGLTLIRSLNPIEIINLPIPDLYCVLVHPHLQVKTADARAALKNEVPLKSVVAQTANLAGFIASLFMNDIELLEKSAVDCMIEPQRAKFIPGFYNIKSAATAAGAIMVSLSGSGPSMFAFAKNQAAAEKIAAAMTKEFTQQNIASDTWIAKLNPKGAYVVNH